MASKQQPATQGQGRLGSFTSSSQEISGPYKKKSSASSINSEARRWKPSVFDFKSGSVQAVCPTCHGTGRIPKGQEDELVALIPYNDKRLKPRRTCLYMSILVVALLVCGGLLTAFLYPRNVDLTVTSIVSLTNYSDTLTNLHSDPDMNVFLEIETTVQIQNSNFFPVAVSSMNVSLISSDQVQVGELSKQSFSVKSRATVTVNVSQNATFTDGLARRTETVCLSPKWEPYIYLEAMVVLSYTYLSHNSDTIANKFQKLDCRGLRLSIPAYTLSPASHHTTRPGHHHTTESAEWL